MFAWLSLYSHSALQTANVMKLLKVLCNFCTYNSVLSRPLCLSHSKLSLHAHLFGDPSYRNFADIFLKQIQLNNSVGLELKIAVS